MASPCVQLYDLERLIRQINGAAYVKAADMATSMYYEKYSESGFVNWMLTGITGYPGYASVQSDDKAIDHMRHNLALKMVDNALSSAGEGNASFDAWIAGMEAERRRHSESLNKTYDDVRRANQEVIDELTKAVRFAATVKYTCTVTLALTPVGALGAGASATIVMQAGAVNFLYGMTKDYAKGLASGTPPSAIAFDIGKASVKEGVQQGIDHAKEKAVERIPEIEKLMQVAEKKINTLSVELGRKISSRKVAKLQRKIERVESGLATQSRYLPVAKAFRLAGKAAPVVFAGWDVWEAIEEYHKDMGWQDH